MQDPKEFQEPKPEERAVREPAELIAEGIETLERLRAQNDAVERILKPKITMINSRGFYTRHVRSRDERAAQRKAQKKARKANR